MHLTRKQLLNYIPRARSQRDVKQTEMTNDNILSTFEGNYCLNMFLPLICVTFIYCTTTKILHRM